MAERHGHDARSSGSSELSARRERRLRLVFALNLAIVAAQAGWGIAAHSLGLVADAGHNLTDGVAVALSLIAVRLTRRKATEQRSYGWHRSGVLAAQANAAGVVAITSLIAFEAVNRLRNPEPVDGAVVVLVALGAMVANGLAALLLREPGNPDLNMRSALLHMASDAAASAGVALTGLVILWTDGYYWLDPVASLLIGLLIAVAAIRLIRATTSVLLESTPEGLDLTALLATMAAVDGVEDVHDVHAWSLSSDVRALSAHLVMVGHPTLEAAQAVAGEVRLVIAERFAIAHATLELECETCFDGDDDPCAMDQLDVLIRPHTH
ncbi:MAG: cation diffusion facilitator family transporter [Acidimicrobiales bacterium]